MKRPATTLAALVLLGLVAGCGARLSSAPPSPPPKPPPATSCLGELEARGIGYEKVPDFHNDEGCGIDQAIRVEHSAIPWNRPSLAACTFELTEWDFETKVVQPAAWKYFKHHVSKLIHAGTYDCRGERGGNASKLSQHALGKAIDVLGFEIDDGTTVSVRKDWVGTGAKALFLHDVAKGACGIFDMVLTPYSNAFHQDHLHLDTGPYKHCGM